MPWGCCAFGLCSLRSLDWEPHKLAAIWSWTRDANGKCTACKDADPWVQTNNLLRDRGGGGCLAAQRCVVLNSRIRSTVSALSWRHVRSHASHTVHAMYLPTPDPPPRIATWPVTLPGARAGVQLGLHRVCNFKPRPPGQQNSGCNKVGRQQNLVWGSQHPHKGLQACVRPGLTRAAKTHFNHTHCLKLL